MGSPDKPKEEGRVKTWQLVVAGIGMFIAGNARECASLSNHVLDHPFEDKKQVEPAPPQPPQMSIWKETAEKTRRAVKDTFFPIIR